MWARTAEVMMGLWLMASPFIFRHPPDAVARWWNDFGTGLLVVVFALLSFGARTRRAHLLNLVVALWLVVFGFAGSGGTPLPSAQNQYTVGLLLLMLALVPARATRPPEGWESFKPGP